MKKQVLAAVLCAAIITIIVSAMVLGVSAIGEHGKSPKGDTSLCAKKVSGAQAVGIIAIVVFGILFMVLSCVIIVDRVRRLEI